MKLRFSLRSVWRGLVRAVRFLFVPQAPTPSDWIRQMEAKLQEIRDELGTAWSRRIEAKIEELEKRMAEMKAMLPSPIQNPESRIQNHKEVS